MSGKAGFSAGRSPVDVDLGLHFSCPARMIRDFHCGLPASGSIHPSASFGVVSSPFETPNAQYFKDGFMILKPRSFPPGRLPKIRPYVHLAVFGYSEKLDLSTTIKSAMRYLVTLGMIQRGVP